MNTAHTKLLGRLDKIKASAINGISNAANLYLSRILIAWIIRWDFVMPISAFGFRLNASMNLCLNLLGMDANKVSPVLPVRLMNTLPCRL